MSRNERTHGESLAAIRAFVANDPLLREVDGKMIAQAAGVVAAFAAYMLAVKGVVSIWL